MPIWHFLYRYRCRCLFWGFVFVLPLLFWLPQNIPGKNVMIAVGMVLDQLKMMKIQRSTSTSLQLEQPNEGHSLSACQEWLQVAWDSVIFQGPGFPEKAQREGRSMGSKTSQEDPLSHEKSRNWAQVLVANNKTRSVSLNQPDSVLLQVSATIQPCCW